jgi:hypothetical protein
MADFFRKLNVSAADNKLMANSFGSLDITLQETIRKS